MSGIFLLAVAAVWIGILVALGWSIGKRFRYPFGPLLGMLVFFGLLPLPVVDEIVGGRQLEALCREGSVLTIDEQKIKGRRVKFASEPLNAEVPHTVIPVTFSRGVLRDEDTGEVLWSRGCYHAKGGMLIRALGISESNSPMFARSYCAPQGEGAHGAAKRLGFTIIN